MAGKRDPLTWTDRSPVAPDAGDQPFSDSEAVRNRGRLEGTWRKL